MPDRRIRVLLVGPHLSDPGGVAVYYNAVLPRISGERISIRYLGIGSSEKSRKLVHKATDQLRFLRALRAHDPDIVHLNPQMDLLSFFRDGFLAFIATMRGRKVLVFYHGWQIGFELAVTRYLLWFFRLTYMRADMFIVLASRFADVLRSWRVGVPILRHHTVVADDLLDGSSLLSKEVRLDFGLDPPVAVLFLSRLVTGKGLWELLGAVRILFERGEKISVSIAGDGPLMPELRRYVDGLEVDDRRRIRILGHVSKAEKARLFQVHDVFCLPTTSEGMPTAVLEAMAFGLSVITCPAGGIADFFENQRMGFLLREATPQHVADAMQQLISDPDRRLRISEYNRDYASRHFLASRAARFMESVYENLGRGGGLNSNE